MRPVSPAYAAYPDERVVDICIKFSLVDIAAAGNATPSATGAEEISQLEQLTDETNHPEAKWATGELGLWLLDGTWDILPDDTSQEKIGLWSVISGADGTFQLPPTLTMELSAPASSIGFSLYFDELAETWPAEVAITAWNGAQFLAAKTFDVTGPVLLAEMPVEDYDRVTFAFLSTPEPYRRVRLYSVLFGIVQIFDRSNTVKASWYAGAAVDGGEFPARQLVWTFDNSDRKYNLINPNGLYRFLQDGQVIESAISIGGELVDMGQHYFKSAQARDGAQTAEITAYDRAWWLDMETYEEGQSGSWPLGEALRAILGPDAIIRADEEILERQVGRCIPPETKKREAIQLLAQAARCSCWIDRLGAYVFRELVLEDPVDILDENNMPAMDGVSVEDRVDQVILQVRDEFAGTEAQEYVAGSGVNVCTVINPVAIAGQAVADWLLAVKKRRLAYNCTSRGNPAVEIGDTIMIYNAYDEPGLANVTGYELNYDGGLSAKMEGVGG